MRGERCDLVIVGAGLAGLNALAAASKYLRRGQRVVLIDRRPRSGGMWNDTYDYVRLHQPHPTFTAGTIRWNLDAPRDHLATRPEVLDHLEHCLAVIQKRLDIDVRFGWEYESHEEIDGHVTVACRAPGGALRQLETERLIKASGFDVGQNEPLLLSSRNVTSVSPDSFDLQSSAIADSDAPIWVVGGGKTAMDTVLTLVSAYPDRTVNLIAGGGTLFQNRDLLFPTGVRRWTSRVTSNAISVQFARRFDGNNEDSVLDWFRGHYALAVTDPATQYLFGILSEAEQRRIDNGITHRVLGRLTDVVDEPDGPRIELDSGESVATPPGSFIVNCTGYLMRKQVGYEPFTSPSGRVISINTRSQTMLLSSHGAYFLTHLMFRDRLPDLPLYAIDSVALRSKSVAAYAAATMACNVHNLGVAFDALPLTTFLFWGTDYDYWYPLPRRGLTQLDFIRGRRDDIPHTRRAMDAVRERFGVRCGPLDLNSDSAASAEVS
ncbi:MAG: FAD-dependent oxidoreductase [Acidimicrobiales bacterium]